MFHYSIRRLPRRVKESFPELKEAKYFIRKPKAIENLVKRVVAIVG